jgi:hypothetical protein
MPSALAAFFAASGGSDICPCSAAVTMKGESPALSATALKVSFLSFILRMIFEASASRSAPAGPP